MTLSRRKFLVKGSLSLAGTMLLSNQLFAAQTAGAAMVGIQLYSVRDEMKADPLGTLKQLAAMGYKNVEHANYVDRKFYGYSATEFRKVLDDLGLKMPSGHTVMADKHWDNAAKDFSDSWKETVEDAAVCGQKYVISPWLDENLRKNYDDLLGFLDIFNKSGELCQKSGMKFGYHNHDFEFKYSLNGKKIYDIILEHTDPKLVIQQMDIGNMYGAGGRALDILKKHPGRFESMHVKDEIKSAAKGEMDSEYESTILGKGILPVKQIVDLFKKSGGTTEFIIEQESYQGKTPLECSKEDLKIMKSWGY
ncbi:MAG: sugar phosphate isomerase/epimerase [Ferruginibacter sp.]|uniref:sugar phosphate isomerase/epimerase family protein n=1 Tax=Ferruginibacter sp. TaxID=1940288 RepID=UPI00265B2BD5|nr:sugar phosphate isomerase/epimerase [Ferruginibacter sp.]MDB5279463.1 sugar phosphate isomerase/epimerase [Ferruginibacter sp.]